MENYQNEKIPVTNGNLLKINGELPTTDGKLPEIYLIEIFENFITIISANIKLNPPQIASATFWSNLSIRIMSDYAN